MGRGRTALRRGLLALVAVLGASLVWAALVLMWVQDDVATAESALRAAADADGLEQLTADLERAEAALRRTDGRLSTPGPVLASWTPVVGRTPDAVRRTVRATWEATRAARAVLAAATEDGGLVRDATVDLAALERFEASLRQGAAATRRPVAALQDAPTRLVPGRVARGVREARSRLQSLPERMAAAADASRAAGGLLGRDGPRHLLVVLENNAELRGTGGLVSVFAQVRAQDGRLQFGAFQDVDSVAAGRDDAVPVAAPEDYSALWGPFKAATTLWKNVNMSPDVPSSSAVLAELAAHSLGQRPDGVVWVDTRTIAAVIGATGDARLPDGTLLTGENAVDQLLSEAYEQVEDTPREQGLRRLRLRSVADVFVQRLTSGGPDLGALGPVLVRMGGGRHLAVWSARSQEQDALESAGAAGAVEAPGGSTDLVSFAVNNFGDGVAVGNKLDYYARRQVSVRVHLSTDEAAVEQEVAVRNTAPSSGLPAYVAGRARPGTTNNHVLFSLPASARDVRLFREDQELPTQRRRQRGHSVVVDLASLSPGTTATWRLSYRVPLEDARYVLRLVPQPLAVDAGLAVQVTAADGLRIGALTGGTLAPDGSLSISGPFTHVRELSMRVTGDSLPRRVLDRLRRFWNEPVPLP